MATSVAKILITGGTGFIGSHLAEFLTSKGADVLALVRNPHRLRFLRGQAVHLLPGDLFTIPDLPSSLEVVFHLAGSTKALKSEDYYMSNERGTASLFKALERQRLHPRVIILSTLAAGGPSAAGRPRKESDPPSPLTPYGKSKFFAEREALARRDRFRVTIIRVGGVYGPRDADFLHYFKFVKRGLVLSLGWRRKPISVCYVNDLIRALDLAAGKNLESGEIFNVGNPVPCTMDEIGRAAALALGKKTIRIPVPLPVVYGACLLSDAAAALTGRPSIINRDKYLEYKQPGWVADVGKARRLLSFETRSSLEEGIRETIAWYTENGWL